MSTPTYTSDGLCFERESRKIPIATIVPLKLLHPTVKKSRKYQQILASIRTVGLIELPAVTPAPRRQKTYYLLDGLLRIEALKELGEEEVECIISTDDEAYTYNKQISQITTVEGHKMIARAVELGASIEQIAEALNLSVSTVRHRFRLLDGLCQETIALLANKHCPMTVLNLLKRMKPIRQIQATEIMVGQNNYSSSFARAMLVATPDEQLVEPRSSKPSNDISHEQIVRLERELEAAQRRTRHVEDTYGVDNLCLTVTKTYLGKLLDKPRIAQWLSRHRPDYLTEFRAIAELASL